MQGSHLRDRPRSSRPWGHWWNSWLRLPAALRVEMGGARPGTLIAVVAGEPSGDLLGAALVKAVQELIPNARFEGVGGPQMQAAGVECLVSMDRLAVRGYVEVLRHFFGILRIRRNLRRRWSRERPDLFVGVDAPDFNLSLEAALRRRSVPTVHLASPSIWAWRAGRIRRIKSAVSHMLTLFPFEAPIYRQAGVPVTFVGHPLADILPAHPDRERARERLRLPPNAAIIALLPGSRDSELEQMADLYVATARMIAQRYPKMQFLVPLVNRTTRDRFAAALANCDRERPNVHLLFGHAHDALMAANVALVASGTATLEAALLGCPMVITYRVPPMTWRIMWPKRRLPYVGLPNVLAGEFIVPELLQDDATPENLCQALLNLLADAGTCERLSARFAAMRETLRADSARSSARAIASLLPAA
jgi:lipid-A-disaccharide synthase